MMILQVKQNFYDNTQLSNNKIKTRGFTTKQLFSLNFVPEEI